MSIISDPVRLEVLKNTFEGIGDGMAITLVRTSRSSVVRTGHDFSTAILTPTAELVGQGMCSPIHLGGMGVALESCLDYYDNRIYPEDIFVNNDPYEGGSHLPDIFLYKPVFVGDRVVAWLCAMSHHTDVGGRVPGGNACDSTEIYQEGNRIPPLKLREGNEFNHTLVEMLKLNVRVPQVFMGDIGAQISACTVGARRVAELAGRYGYGQTLRIFNELLDRSEQLTRKALEAIPDGTYSYVDYLDNDGVNLDESVRIEVAVTVSGSELHCDFEGTDPQTRGPFNAVKSGSQAAAYYAVRAVTDSSIPTNGGCFRPVSLHLPEGTLVNPVEPAPVNSRTATLKRIAGSIVGALKGALPEQIPADSAGELLVLSLGGKNLSGKPYVVGEFNAGGSGGGPRKDGVDVIETDGSNCMNMPVEALELEAPARVHRMSLRTDSGGVGEFRGGLGCVREIEFLTDNIALTHRGERHRHAARGSQGGGDGAKAFSKIVRRDGTEEVVNSKLFTMVHSGERLIVETAGGGGYGDPNGRDREAVQDDLRNRKVSERSAMNDYGLSN